MDSAMDASISAGVNSLVRFCINLPVTKWMEKLDICEEEYCMPSFLDEQKNGNLAYSQWPSENDNILYANNLLVQRARYNRKARDTATTPYRKKPGMLSPKQSSKLTVIEDSQLLEFSASQIPCNREESSLSLAEGQCPQKSSSTTTESVAPANTPEWEITEIDSPTSINPLISPIDPKSYALLDTLGNQVWAKWAPIQFNAVARQGILETSSISHCAGQQEKEFIDQSVEAPDFLSSIANNLGLRDERIFDLPEFSIENIWPDIQQESFGLLEQNFSPSMARMV